MELNRKTIKSILFVVFVSISMYYLFGVIGELPKYLMTALGLISPIIVGCVLAFILNGPMSGIETLLFSHPEKRRIPISKGLARTISMLLTFLLLIGILLGMMFIIIPEILKTISSLTAQIPQFFGQVEAFIQKLTKDSPFIQNILSSSEFRFERLQVGFIEFLKNVSGTVLNSTLNFSIGLVSFLMNMLFGVFLALYILAQKERLGRQFRSLLYAYFKEEKVDRLLEISKMSSKMFSRFINGQLLEAFILSMMFLVSMSLLRLPYAVLISLIVMILALIPILGAYVACALGSLLILIAEPQKVLFFFVLFLVLQQIEGNFIYPRVVGKSVGLSSMWVLVAITIGSGIAGIPGMIFSIPIVSILYTLLSANVHRRLNQKKLPYYKSDESEH